MKSTGNHGSLVPLNLRLRQQTLSSPMVKSESHEARALRESRAGTPPTRWGMFNGAMPATTPGQAPGPQLYLGKAVIDPSMAGGQASDRTPRKRGPDGKFATSQSAGPASTAEEDLANREREARLVQRRYQKGFGDPPGQDEAAAGSPQGGMQPPAGPPGQDPGQGGPPQLARPKPNPMQQAGVSSGPPGQSQATGQMSAAANQGAAGGMGMQEQPMGMTPDGMPVFDDPYNPAHSVFTPDQHQAAAQLHNQQAEMATTSGRIPTALDHQLKARIHMDLANDSQSPMQRMMANQGMPGAAQGAANGFGGGAPGASAGGGDPMDDFLSQMTTAQPGAQNMSPDQNKPAVATPQMNQGPLPGMMNTNTGGPVGPQSQQAMHAGTVEQPQGMPPSPPPGNGSMPDISGQLPQPMEQDPLEWNPEDFLDDDGGGGGAMDAPPSHGGAPTEAGPDEGEMPTPGASESEPPTEGAGPSTEDKGPEAKKPSAESGPFSGNPTDEKAEEFAQKSLTDWFNKI